MRPAAQAMLLGLVIVAWHILAARRDAGRWPRSWATWREALAAAVVVVAGLAIVTGGRGCAGPPIHADADQ